MKKLLLLVIFLFGCMNQDYPKNLSWGNIDIDGNGTRENYLTPIKDQPCSDCYIYATLGLLEMQYKIDHRITSSLDLSEQNIHNCLRFSCKTGGDPKIILHYLQKYGAVEERYVKTGQWTMCQNCSPYFHNESGMVHVKNVPFFRFSRFKTIIGPNMPYPKRKKALVEALQSGPVLIIVRSWNGYEKTNNTRHCKGFQGGPHAAIVVGYFNHGDVFLIKNSHGESSTIKMAFKGGEKCSFADVAIQIVPNTTYVENGSGAKYCESEDDRDEDSVPDVNDSCTWDKNPDQKDSDGDSYGDKCDKCPLEKGMGGFHCGPLNEMFIPFEASL